MSRSLNRVTLLGNVGNDAEVKHLEGGACILRFPLATERRYKSGEEWKTETEWHNITVWNNEKLAEFVKRGTKVYIEGRLRTRSFEDPQSGGKRYFTEIVASDLILCGKPQSTTEVVQRSQPVQAEDDLSDEIPF